MSPGAIEMKQPLLDSGLFYFFSVTKKIKKSYNPPDHIKKKKTRKITIFFPFPASLPSLDCDFCH